MTADIEYPASFTKTYKRADGQDIDGHTWVHTLDWFDDFDEPFDVVEEIWQRISVQVLHFSHSEDLA